MPRLNVNLLIIIKGADCQRKNVSCGPEPLWPRRAEGLKRRRRLGDRMILFMTLIMWHTKLDIQSCKTIINKTNSHKDISHGTKGNKVRFILIMKNGFWRSEIYSKRKLEYTCVIINSERHAGSTYKFCKRTETSYACTSCKALGISRTVTVKNGRILSLKHPEDDHHKDCRPFKVLATDRETSFDISGSGEQLDESSTHT